jgi:hypothetical protein
MKTKQEIRAEIKRLKADEKEHAAFADKLKCRSRWLKLKKLL